MLDSLQIYFVIDLDMFWFLLLVESSINTQPCQNPLF